MNERLPEHQMQPQDPSRIDIIRQAIDLFYQHRTGGTPEELRAKSDSAITRYWRKYKLILAGPVVSIKEGLYDIGDPQVIVPRHIKHLFMYADGVIREAAYNKAGREDQITEKYHRDNPKS